MACGDVLSLEDLQTAKKHQIFEAEVITGKVGGLATGADIDYATNQVTGQVQKTMPAVLRGLGFVVAGFNFDTGGTLAVGDENKVVLWPGPGGDGQYYSWHGQYPKTIPHASTPASAGGISPTGWALIDGVALRQELIEDNGSAIVQYRFKGLASSTKRTVGEKLDEHANLLDFHCDVDGVFIQPGPSVDSRPYIQNAIDHLSSVGGGTLTIPKIDGAWYLGSFGIGVIAGHAGVIQLRSNVNLCIEGKIQLGSFFSGISFQVFVGFDSGDPAASGNLSNCHIYGFGVIDLGNFPSPAAGNKLRNVVTFGKSYGCSLSDMTIQNGDVTWGATIGWNGFGSHTVVENVHFVNLIQSDNNPDHSTVYVNAPYSGVNNCTFTSTHPRARVIACTVELHQHDTWYTNSRITGYIRGCYVVMHSSESAGAGLYSFNTVVGGNIGDVNGQFVIFGTDVFEGVSSHISSSLVIGNIIGLSFGYNFGSFIDIAPPNAGGGSLTDNDVHGVLVTGNSYTASSEASFSAVMTANASIKGITFTNNYFDARKMIDMAGPSVGVAQCHNLVWDESNTIGAVHSGLRAGLNLFEMRFSEVLSSNITVRLSHEDTSMFSVILFPPSCNLSYSTIKVLPDFTGNMGGTAVFEGGQQVGANVYAEYPVNVDFTSYGVGGAVPFFSTTATFGWVTHAYPLTSGGGPDFHLPAAWTSTSTGQLWGMGYNETGASRVGSVRLMAMRKI